MVGVLKNGVVSNYGRLVRKKIPGYVLGIGEKRLDKIYARDRRKKMK